MPRVIPPTDAGIDAWLGEVLNLERTGDYRDLRLDRMRDFMRLLPTPPAPWTVTGTKGKGSTVRLIEAALLAAGEPTLAFTSPHLSTVRERWRIDGLPADAASIAAACAQVDQLESGSGTRLTYFERCFAIACLLASARPGVSFICEVGLGGRLDCANVLDAAVLVLTNLSRDHCQILGDTLEAIAGEKLALCRSGRPLVVAPQSPAGAEAARGHIPDQVPVTWAQRPARPYRLALLGEHQQDNAASAAAALALLRPALDDERVRDAFAGARLAGRCQLIVQPRRRILVDGAHNGVSVAATIATAERALRPGWRLLIGVARDKDIDEILAALPDGVVTARVGYANPRARGAAEWPSAALAWPWHATIGAALAAQTPGADVCVTGSLYLAGEALAVLGEAGSIPG